MKYIKTKDIQEYVKDKRYATISITGSLIGMKKNYGWNRAKEILKSGKYYYAIW